MFQRQHWLDLLSVFLSLSSINRVSINCLRLKYLTIQVKNGWAGIMGITMWFVYM